MKKTKNATLALCAALVLGLLAACGGGSGGGSATVTLTNESGYVFNEVYLSPTESDEWGSDQLGGTNILKSGGSHDIALDNATNGLYDVLAVDEDGDSWLFERVPLEKGSALAIYSDGTAVSTSPDGTETTVNGELAYADEDSYDDGGEEEDSYSDQGIIPPDDGGDAAWVDMTFYNNTSYSFPEIYIYDENIVNESEIGYNHAASAALADMGSLDIGVEQYDFYDVILVDDVGDAWYFQGVEFAPGCVVHVLINTEGDPTLEVSYGYTSANNYYYGSFEAW